MDWMLVGDLIGKLSTRDVDFHLGAAQHPETPFRRYAQTE